MQGVVTVSGTIRTRILHGIVSVIAVLARKCLPVRRVGMPGHDAGCGLVTLHGRISGLMVALAPTAPALPCDSRARLPVQTHASPSRVHRCGWGAGIRRG